MRKSTIYINADTSNPIAVEVILEAEKEAGNWSWSISEIETVELIISDKEGVNITSRIKGNPRALALLTAQVADEQDQIISALTEGSDENEVIDQIRRAS